MAQNELEKTLNKVLDEKVIPEFKKVNERLDKVEKKLDATMEMTAKNSEEITLLKDDFSDMGYTVERIETKLDATIRRQDDASVKNYQLARRVLKLETKAK